MEGKSGNVLLDRDDFWIGFCIFWYDYLIFGVLGG